MNCNSIKLASRKQRLSAYIIDIMPILLVNEYIYRVNLSISRTTSFVFIIIAIALFFQLLLLSTKGQTLGKLIIGIKIVDVNNMGKCGFIRVVIIRTIFNLLLCAIPFYGMVDAIYIFNEDNKCLHDKLAQTIVIIKT